MSRNARTLPKPKTGDMRRGDRKKAKALERIERLLKKARPSSPKDDQR